MFFKTIIIVLLMMQWRFQDITAETVDLDSKLSEINNDIKTQGKKFEDKLNTMQETLRDLKEEENYLLALLTGQQKAHDRNLTLMRNVQEDIKLKQIQMEETQRRVQQTQNADHTKINLILDSIKKLSCQLPVLSLKTQFINNRRYYMSHDQPRMSWAEAEKFCKSHGMDLVSIETQQEWDVLKPEVEKLANKIGTFPWCSGSDAAQEGKWKWAATGSDVTFFATQHNKTNNPSANCLYLHTEYWDDAPCSHKYSFICEQNQLC